MNLPHRTSIITLSDRVSVILYTPVVTNIIVDPRSVEPTFSVLRIACEDGWTDRILPFRESDAPQVLVDSGRVLGEREKPVPQHCSKPADHYQGTYTLWTSAAGSRGMGSHKNKKLDQMYELPDLDPRECLKVIKQAHFTPNLGLTDPRIIERMR